MLNLKCLKKQPYNLGGTQKYSKSMDFQVIGGTSLKEDQHPTLPLTGSITRYKEITNKWWFNRGGDYDTETCKKNASRRHH